MRIDSRELLAAFEWLHATSAWPFLSEYYLLTSHPDEILTLRRTSSGASSSDGSVELHLAPPDPAIWRAEDAYECGEGGECDSDWPSWDECPD